MPPEGLPRPRLCPYLAATMGACLMGLMGVFVRHISVSDETIVLARFGLGCFFVVCFGLSDGRFRKVT
jgi:hypothetical protein